MCRWNFTESINKKKVKFTVAVAETRTETNTRKSWLEHFCRIQSPYLWIRTNNVVRNNFKKAQIALLYHEFHDNT